MPALGQFVDSVPHPLTLSLLNLAPLLSIAAHITRLATWQLDSYSSWLTLAAWWLFCLAAPPLFRYLLPLVLVLAFIFYPPSHSTPLVTESILQNAIVDFNTLSTPLPSLPPLSLPPFALLRAAAILTLPWLFITHLIPTRIIFAVIGSLVLIHRAPWALVLRSVLWRSAFVRAILHRIQALLTGQNLPKYVVSNHPTQTTPQPASSLRFLFTIYENQRWWMGLDWTAALLPSERPSWCSPSLHPLSPPNAFTLPDPITIYLPSPDAKSRIKRTAIWKWEEPEWRLLIRKEGTSLSRIERPPPAIDDSSPLSPSSSATSSGGSRLLKAAAIKFKESSTSSPQSSSSTTTSPPADIDPASDQDDSVEPFTDPDGWIYADNKWENQSHRGGLGKVTLPFPNKNSFTHYFYYPLVHPPPTLDPCGHCH